jgi:hypothetical protein
MGVNVDWIKMIVFTQWVYLLLLQEFLQFEVTYYWPTLGQGISVKNDSCCVFRWTPLMVEWDHLWYLYWAII